MSDGPTEAPGARTWWVVDGNNVVGCRPDGWWRDRRQAARRLVPLLARLRGRSNVPLTVVFDGPEDPGAVAAGTHGGVEVVFAPGGPNAADDVIAQLVSDDGPATGVTVVTSDRALSDRVRAEGAVVMGARTFRHLIESGEPPAGSAGGQGSP